MAKEATKRIPKPVTRVTVVDTVTEQLRRLILSGALKDGSPLRQDALAEEMGTSRIPVREALSRLESEGLVASFPHRGYVVTGLSRAEIQELFDLRAMLEPELIRLAIPNFTDAVHAEAATLLRKFDDAIAADDIHSWGELNRRFHMVLYAPSGRTRTLEIVRGLLINSDRYTQVLLTLGKSFARALEEHGALLDLCRKRQVNQAVALTRDHIQTNGDELIMLLDKRGFAP
ncbi:MAG TPA: GntR family transcriptional regulator [Steroidobacter sp.]|uniref:GntR family transcriptional regulator n=1 Tax=Steroidobacter sp. TaxID=1978227 RepID=UPI002ED8D322